MKNNIKTSTRIVKIPSKVLTAYSRGLINRIEWASSEYFRRLPPLFNDDPFKIHNQSITKTLKQLKELIDNNIITIEFGKRSWSPYGYTEVKYLEVRFDRIKDIQYILAPPGPYSNYYLITFQ